MALHMKWRQKVPNCFNHKYAEYHPDADLKEIAEIFGS